MTKENTKMFESCLHLTCVYSSMPCEGAVVEECCWTYTTLVRAFWCMYSSGEWTHKLINDGSGYSKHFISEWTSGKSEYPPIHTPSPPPPPKKSQTFWTLSYTHTHTHTRFVSLSVSNIQTCSHTHTQTHVPSLMNSQAVSPWIGALTDVAGKWLLSSVNTQVFMVRPRLSKLHATCGASMGLFTCVAPLVDHQVVGLGREIKTLWFENDNDNVP